VKWAKHRKLQIHATRSAYCIITPINQPISPSSANDVVAVSDKKFVYNNNRYFGYRSGVRGLQLFMLHDITVQNAISAKLNRLAARHEIVLYTIDLTRCTREGLWPTRIQNENFHQGSLWLENPSLPRAASNI